MFIYQRVVYLEKCGYNRKMAVFMGKTAVKSAVDLGTWKGAKQVHADSACNYGAVVLNIMYPVT